MFILLFGAARMLLSEIKIQDLQVDSYHMVRRSGREQWTLRHRPFGYVFKCGIILYIVHYFIRRLSVYFLTTIFVCKIISLCGSESCSDLFYTLMLYNPSSVDNFNLKVYLYGSLGHHSFGVIKTKSWVHLESIGKAYLQVLSLCFHYFPEIKKQFPLVYR